MCFPLCFVPGCNRRRTPRTINACGKNWPALSISVQRHSPGNRVATKLRCKDIKARRFFGSSMCCSQNVAAFKLKGLQPSQHCSEVVSTAIILWRAAFTKLWLCSLSCRDCPARCVRPFARCLCAEHGGGWRESQTIALAALRASEVLRAARSQPSSQGLQLRIARIAFDTIRGTGSGPQPPMKKCPRGKQQEHEPFDYVNRACEIFARRQHVQ